MQHAPCLLQQHTCSVWLDAILSAAAQVLAQHLQQWFPDKICNNAHWNSLFCKAMPKNDGNNPSLYDVHKSSTLSASTRTALPNRQQLNTSNTMALMPVA